MKDLVSLLKPNPGCALALCAVLLLGQACPARAQIVAFDFDTGTPGLTTGQNLPFDQTAGGVVAHFSAAAGGFSVQDDLSTQLQLHLFSGKYLYPNSTGAVLVIQFSQELTNITCNFATAEQTPIENPTPIRLTAYTNSISTPDIGTTTAAGAYGFGSLPMGRLVFSSTIPFNVVKLNIEPGGATGFLLDNLTNRISNGTRYTIATSAWPQEGGTTSGDGTYLDGAAVTVVAVPNPGYAFVNWTENNVEVSAQPTYDFAASGFRTLVAHFVPTYAILTIASPVEGGTTSGDGIYTSGSSAVITATPNSRYAFVNWTENGIPVSSWLNCTRVVTHNQTMVANFAVACTIATSSASPGAGSTTGAGVYALGSRVAVCATPKSGYAFVNWTEGGVPVSTSPVHTFTANTARTLVANFVSDDFHVTFDFDTAVPRLTNSQATAFEQTSGGVVAYFSTTNDPAFSIQNDINTGWILPGVSGNYLAPNIPGAVLEIQFSQWVTNLTLSFATLDFQEIVIPSTLQLTAYQNLTGPSIATASTQGIYHPGDSMPQGGITLDSVTPFRIVRITKAPSSLGETDFIVDNIAVATVPQPELALFLTATNAVVVSWPAAFLGYTLQENPAVDNAVGWTDNTDPINVVGGRNQVIVSPSGTCFYRLLRR